MSRGKNINQEIYFSSSEQEQHQSTMKSQAMQQEIRNEVDFNINELSGLELFDIFCDEVQLQSMVSKQARENGITLKFYWRVHYLIGEIAIEVQQLLLQGDRLANCLVLQNHHIDKVAMFLWKKMEDRSKDPQYLRVRDQMSQFYKSSTGNIKLAASIYSYLIKVAFGVMKFDMVLDFKKSLPPSTNMTSEMIVGEKVDGRKKQPYNPQSSNVLINHKGDPRIGNYQIMQMPELTKNPPEQFVPRSSQKQTGNATRGQSDKVQNGKQKMGKSSVVRGWTAKEEGVLCKNYAESQNSTVICQLMQRQLGPDPRWKNVSGIQSQIRIIVQKVFNKFANHVTKNQHIKTFKQNRKLVMQESDRQTRKKMFRSIVVIYDSMLNAGEQKRAIISQKILHVNRMCRDFVFKK